MFQYTAVMNYSKLILISCTIWAGACSSNDQPPYSAAERSYQAISALGDTLYAPPLDPDTQSRLETELKSARASYQTNPKNVETALAYARQLTYMGDYQQAIAVLSKTIEAHPRRPELYRQRGEQYIIMRKFDRAIDDLRKATELLMESTEKQQRYIESQYYLGVASYLSGAYGQAQNAFEECLRTQPDDDRRAAVSYWLYMTLRRNGMDGLAGEVLEPISRDMNITDHQQQHQLLLVFKGIFDPNIILNQRRENPAIGQTAAGYGLGNWHYINGRPERAKALFQQVYRSKQWTELGYIAAETDLARLFDQ